MAGALAAILGHEVTSYSGIWQYYELGSLGPSDFAVHSCHTSFRVTVQKCISFMRQFWGAFCNSQHPPIKTDSELPPGLSLRAGESKGKLASCSQGGLWAWRLLGARGKGWLSDFYLGLSLQVSLY